MNPQKPTAPDLAAEAAACLRMAGIEDRRFDGHTYSRLYLDRWVIDGDVLEWDAAIAALLAPVKVS